MKRFLISAALSVLTAGAAMAPAAFAFAPPPHGDDRGHHDDHGRPDNHGHPDWRAGGRIEKSDWGRGHHLDYRAHHLRQPPRGYEWREVDGNYVLAAVATGIIASVILNSH